MFECTSDGTYVDIRHVSLEPKDGVPSETTYTGPVFPVRRPACLAGLPAQLGRGQRLSMSRAGGPHGCAAVWVPCPAQGRARR